MGFIRTSIMVLVVAVLINKIPSWLSSKPSPPPLQGYVAPGWEKVKSTYKKLFEDGEDWGSSFSIYHQGVLVVDLYGGYANEEGEWPWQPDTVTRLFSTSKGIGAIACAMLVDRGYLDYKKPVVHYWPEFGVHGKDNVTVEILLSHQAGLVAITDDSYSIFDELNDIKKLGHLLANVKPLWPPGTKVGYHGLTIGLYMDQLVRRVDPKKRGIQQFLKEEVAVPFDLDLHFGLPLAEHWRGAHFKSQTQLISPSIFFSDFGWMVLHQILFPSSPSALMGKYPKDGMKAIALNNPSTWQLWNPSMAGWGNGRALAKLYGIIANGGRFGDKTLLSKATIAGLTHVMIEGYDEVMRIPVRWGRSFVIKDAPLGDSKLFGTAGYGGQDGFGDLTHSLGFGYTTSFGTLDTALGKRFEALAHTAYECLFQIQKSQ